MTLLTPSEISTSTTVADCKSILDHALNDVSKPLTRPKLNLRPKPPQFDDAKPSDPTTPVTPGTPCSSGVPCSPLTPNKRSTMNDFKLQTVLGRGSYGKVVKAKRKKDGCIVALKMMQKEELTKNDVLTWVEQEKKVVEKISKNPHPFISKVEETFRTKALVVHVMEFLSGGDLAFHLRQAKGKKFPVDQAKFYFAEVALAIHHLHKHHILYRDLKPDNVLLRKDGHIALADFGFAKIVDPKDPKQTEFCGSLEFLAPEMINGDVKPYGFEVDWWSAGVLLHNLLTGQVPWTSNNPAACYDKICSQPLAQRKLGDEEFAFLSQMLDKDLSQRICTFEAIKAHPFMSDIDWVRLEARDITPPFVPELEGDETKYFDKELTALPAQVSIAGRQSEKPAAGQVKGKGNGEGKAKKRK